MDTIGTTVGHKPPAQPQPRSSGWRVAAWVFATLLLLALALSGLTLWLMGSQAGTRWLLNLAPGLTVKSSKGALLDKRFAAQGVRWHDPVGGQSLEIDQLSWQGAQWSFLPGAGAWLKLSVAEIQLGKLLWKNSASPAARLQAPSSLRFPFLLDLELLTINSLQWDEQEPAQDIKATLKLGSQLGAEHRLDLQQMRWKHIDLLGTGAIKTDGPHPLDMRVSARSLQGVPWSAQADLQGPLSSLALQLKLSVQAKDRGPDPSLDARAQIRPFEAWVLGAVDVTAHQFDLASVFPDAPRTRLSGHATIRSQGLREPVSVDVQMDNAAPARMDEGGLPILSVKALIKVNPRQPDRLEIGPFVVDAADTRGAAGRWSGSGSWAAGQLELQTRLNDLQPARLDRRLAAMQLNGPVNVVVQGLPSPDPAQWQTPWKGLTGLRMTTDAQLAGRVNGAPDQVQLTFSAELDPQGVQVKQLQASSGAAQARLTGRLVRIAGARWQVTSEGELKAFDPRVWFPGTSATWGTGQQLFNGRWDLDVSAPALGSTTPLAQWLPLMLGRADFKLSDSRLAGLPLQATLELRQSPRSSTESSPSRARVDLRLASAQLQITGQGDASDSGAQDRSQVTLNVPTLNELAPLASLQPQWSGWSPKRGELRLQADVTGRWPELSGSFDVQATKLLAGPLAVGNARISGQVPKQRNDGLLMQADMASLQWQDIRLETLRGQLQGSFERHQLDVTASAALVPPAPLAQALQWSQSGQARAELKGRGSWTRESSEVGMAGRWAGVLERLSIGDARSGVPPEGMERAWLEIKGAEIEAQTSSSGQLKSVALKPGEARSGALKMRWSEASWASAAAGPPAWRWLGELEPVAIAPLLQRAAGPSAGGTQWAGDLRVGARMDLRANDRFFADVLVRRESGDLVVADGNSTTALELERAELRLQAQDGVWRFMPQVQGRGLGRLEGELIARTPAAQRWPTRETPIEGSLTARVASLAAWGRWLPTGWMLQGEFDALARLSGTWGEPGYTGNVNGEQVVIRNPLQGVDLKEGRLRVRLEGETARIETLSIRGGDGLLTAQGQARFGAKPEMTLTAKADQLRVLGRVDRQLVLSGETQLKLNADRLDVQGRIKADSGLFDLTSRDAPSLDSDVVVLRQTQSPATAAANTRTEPSPWAKQARVALDLDMGSQLRLRGRGLNTGLTGQLRLTTPNGQSFFQGSIQATGGTYAAYGQKLTIERGQINFNGSLDRARLDILALRPNLDTRVGVVITGSALDPRIRLYSDPDMSESDKLSWLVLGRGPEGLGTTDTALLQRAAVALLAGEGESPSDAALRKLGLDDFSIRQSDGEVRETVVTVGKQLGRRWYVGYERGVNATAGTWQLVYRLAQRFTLRAQSGSDNSLDMIWTWRFGQP